MTRFATILLASKQSVIRPVSFVNPYFVNYMYIKTVILREQCMLS